MSRRSSKRDGKKWPIIVGILVVLGIIGAFGNNDETDSIASEPSAIVETSTQTPETDAPKSDASNEPVIVTDDDSKEDSKAETSGEKDNTAKAESGKATAATNISSFDISTVPAYAGSPYTLINGNVPFFTKEDMTTTSYEYYSDLDSKGRCGVAVACVGQDIMLEYTEDNLALFREVLREIAEEA